MAPNLIEEKPDQINEGETEGRVSWQQRREYRTDSSAIPEFDRVDTRSNREPAQEPEIGLRET
jgi:hypothetical protein